MEIDFSYIKLPREKVVEFAFLPSGRIVAMTKYESFWFEVDGTSKKGSYLIPCPKKDEIVGEISDKKPKIICLCGSTRFTEQMLIKQWELTKQGFIVLSWCVLPDSYLSGEDKTHIGDQEGVKEIVDEVHKRKIDIADEILVLNIQGYIGESTRSEINYALKHNKIVKYLEEEEFWDH